MFRKNRRRMMQKRMYLEKKMREHDEDKEEISFKLSKKLNKITWCLSSCNNHGKMTAQNIIMLTPAAYAHTHHLSILHVLHTNLWKKSSWQWQNWKVSVYMETTTKGWMRLTYIELLILVGVYRSRGEAASTLGCRKRAGDFPCNNAT